MFAEARSSVWRPLAVVESCRGWRRIAVSAAHSAQPGACAPEDDEEQAFAGAVVHLLVGESVQQAAHAGAQVQFSLVHTLPFHVG